MRTLGRLDLGLCQLVLTKNIKMANRRCEYLSKSNLKIIQLNVLSWNNTARRLWITLYIREKSPDIVLLNSTSLVCTEHNKNNLTQIKLENYKSYLTKQEIHYGSAILVRNNLNHCLIPNLSDASIAVKVQTAIGPIIVYTAYIPPRIRSINPLDFQKLISINVSLLVVGDFNAIHLYFDNYSMYVCMYGTIFMTIFVSLRYEPF